MSSIAFAKVANATVQFMNDAGVQAWRKERLRALAEKFGGKAELGRKLGHRDGAYVGQMLSGDRPITEKLILKVEALPGYRGWFSQDASSPKGEVFERLSTEEKELLRHWRVLLGKDRRSKLAQIAALAKERLAEREELFAEAGVTAIAERAAHASHKKTFSTSVEPGKPKSKQRSLLDETDKQ